MIWLFVKRLDFMKFYPKRDLDQIATAAYREKVVYSLLVISSLQTGQSPWGIRVINPHRHN
jgi:hypothetical protein